MVIAGVWVALSFRKNVLYCLVQIFTVIHYNETQSEILISKSTKIY